MDNTTSLRGLCPAPFYSLENFGTGGYVDGRLCQALDGLNCCLPCPMTDWIYPNNFNQVTSIGGWVSVAGTVCCVFLLASWIMLPVEKTHRHYLSISLVCAIMCMNLGFIIPLAAKPEQCYDEITPNGMRTSSVCAASGAFLLGGGWAGVMWIFLRSLSLHLQICWQMVVGRTFMWISQVLGWGIPILGLTVLLVFSGVSFRFGQTCHINHENSLGDFWIPLLCFAGLTVIMQFATFGYCIKVYLASLTDNAAPTDNSGLPSYTTSIVTMTPAQAYRRVRRVIQLQWRGIVIVLIIISDVVFFAVVFVFQDNTLQTVEKNPTKSLPWVLCLIEKAGDKNACLSEADDLAVNMSTIVAVLVLLAMNGIWLVFLLGRWTMVTGWLEWAGNLRGSRDRREFVSVDARLDRKDPRTYEMLSRQSGKTTDTTLTPISHARTPATPGQQEGFKEEGEEGRPQTSPVIDYFGPRTTPYQPHARSFSQPRPLQNVRWETEVSQTSVYTRATTPQKFDVVGPLGMDRL